MKNIYLKLKSLLDLYSIMKRKNIKLRDYEINLIMINLIEISNIIEEKIKIDIESK